MTDPPLKACTRCSKPISLGTAAQWGGRPVYTSRFLEDGFEAIAALEQAQPLQMLLETLQLGGGHADTSARVRSSPPEAPGAALARGAAMSVFPSSAS